MKERVWAKQSKFHVEFMGQIKGLSTIDLKFLDVINSTIVILPLTLFLDN